MHTLFPKHSLESATKIHLVSEECLLTNQYDVSIPPELSFEGKYKQVVFLPESKKIYLGTTLPHSKHCDPWDKVDYYELGAIAMKAVAKTKLDTFMLSGFASISKDIGFQQKGLIQFVLGMCQAVWRYDHFRDESKKNSKSLTIGLDDNSQKLLTPQIQNEIEALLEGITLAREVIDMPPQLLNPQTVVNRIHHEFDEHPNISINLYTSLELEEMGMEAILSVGRASIHSPVLSHVTLKPKGKVKHKIALVGKGLTYDSGGLDIKVGGYMKSMKSDMGGAGTMFGVMKALAQMKLQHTEVHWISAFVENMVGGNAFKSDDVITSYSGQTIEVINTDAEGRLTLADALTFATLQDPDCIIDAATLTGACIRAVSEHFTAMMGNDQTLIDALYKVCLEESEKIVHTPMPEVLREQVQGDIADLLNLGKDAQVAGHITAGLFLSYFVDQHQFRNSRLEIKDPKSYSWLHLDIAGSSYNKGKNPLGVTGATGALVRALARYIQNLDTK
jgi:leucyl aminopeptidase